MQQELKQKSSELIASQLEFKNLAEKYKQLQSTKAEIESKLNLLMNPFTANQYTQTTAPTTTSSVEVQTEPDQLVSLVE